MFSKILDLALEYYIEMHYTLKMVLKIREIWGFANLWTTELSLAPPFIHPSSDPLILANSKSTCCTECHKNFKRKLLILKNCQLYFKCLSSPCPIQKGNI